MTCFSGDRVMGDGVMDYKGIFGSADEQSADGHVCRYARTSRLLVVGPRTNDDEHEKNASPRPTGERTCPGRVRVSGRVLFFFD